MATRCPACGTVFRVVRDQLRVSAGWVRCGRCAEAFNAIEALMEIDAPRAATEREAAFLTPADPATPAPDVIEGVADDGLRVAAENMTDDTAGEVAGIVEAEEPAQLFHAVETAAPAAQDLALAAAAAGVSSMAEPSDEVFAEPADAAEATEATERVEPAPQPDPQPAPTASSPSLATSPNKPAAAAGGMIDLRGVDTEPALAPLESLLPAGNDIGVDAALDRPAVAPSFLRRAEQAERWQRPWVRTVLGLGVVAALLALGGQAAYTYRDWLAVTVPAVRPLLAEACAMLSCRIGEYRQIESLTVESSGLVRMEGTQMYRLSVVLRNRAPLELAAPAVDLSLTDAQGRLIARRVLTMTDLGLALRSLKSGSELPIQVSLGVNDRAVSGYTVEIFYP